MNGPTLVKTKTSTEESAAQLLLPTATEWTPPVKPVAAVQIPYNVAFQEVLSFVTGNLERSRRTMGRPSQTGCGVHDPDRGLKTAFPDVMATRGGIGELSLLPPTHPRRDRPVQARTDPGHRTYTDPDCRSRTVRSPKTIRGSRKGISGRPRTPRTRRRSFIIHTSCRVG